MTTAGVGAVAPREGEFRLLTFVLALWMSRLIDDLDLDLYLGAGAGKLRMDGWMGG